MLFSSIIFLFYFFPVTLIVYFLLGFSRHAQNLWLLCVSLLFYAWGEPIFVLLMILSILANTLFGYIVDKVREDKSKARLTIIAASIFNLGLLFIFKYLGFTIRNINALLASDVIPFTGFALPLGISFFTFQAFSYVIDVYRRDAEVEKNPFYVGLYIAFFPQLVAGPIVRYSDIAEQIRTRRITISTFSYGCCRFTAGIGKKVLISNSMAIMADHIFNLSAMSGSTTIVPMTMAWLGIVAYTLQIYFDFSGYSDMAIGLGHMFGFEFKENFNYPYIADSVVDFWRRWHISLSTWFKEYLYIPLGGSRVENSDLMVRNTFIVWVLTGVWHGAEWTFVLWGLWNFIFIIFERLINFSKLPIPKFLRHIYLLLVVGIGWMIFRAKDMYQAFLYFRNVVGMNNNGFFSDTAFMFLREYRIFLLFGILFSMPVAPKLREMIESKAIGKWDTVFNFAYPAICLFVFAVCVTYLAKGSYNPFIYFNF